MSKKTKSTGQRARRKRRVSPKVKSETARNFWSGGMPQRKRRKSK